MINPYVKKDDVLELVKKLAGDNEYINRHELQRAVTSVKEYRKPKELKFYKPYKITGSHDSIEACIERYREQIKRSPLKCIGYELAIQHNLEPPFKIRYNNEIISIADIQPTLEEVGRILGVVKGTYNKMKKETYIIKYRSFIVIHKNGELEITYPHYNIHDILITLKKINRIKSIIY